jgi:hypothetical protein
MSDDEKSSVYATLHFDLDNPEGERRLRECLDAPRVKLVLWHLNEWLRSEVKYQELSDDVVDTLNVVRSEIIDLCDEYNVNLED